MTLTKTNSRTSLVTKGPAPMNARLLDKSIRILLATILTVPARIQMDKSLFFRTTTGCLPVNN
jgi:hypothetical protein